MQISLQVAELKTHTPRSPRISDCPKLGLGMIVALLIATLVSASRSQPSSKSSTDSASRVTTDINLVVSTNKKQYRVEEAITIYAFLENLSETRYYVGRTFYSLLNSGLHDLELELVDAHGRNVSLPRSAGDWIWKPDVAIKDKVAQEYIELAPSLIYGIRETLELKLRPGIYEMFVVYRENEAVSWKPSETENLRFPVWTKPLKSNKVTIFVK